MGTPSRKLGQTHGLAALLRWRLDQLHSTVRPGRHRKAGPCTTTSSMGLHRGRSEGAVAD